jgi:8-amino-7-oxononanoate synthase
LEPANSERAEPEEADWAVPDPAAGPPPASWAGWVTSRNSKARAKNRWRELAELDALGPRGHLGRQPVVSFASNDYLGLSCHPRVLAAAHDALDRWGAGAGASRLIGGSRPVHQNLEAELAAWKKTDKALVFPSGFATNLGVLAALAGPGVLICGDALNHASIIDGCRLASVLGASFSTYPHRDHEAAAALVGRWPGRAVVVTDTVFSMDGDCAPVVELAEACARRGALLVLDEAHSVLGPHVGPLPGLVLRVGTLSKMLGSQGGFVAGPRDMVEMLVNRCRSFIFTTGLAPASAAAALAALEVLRSEEGAQLVARLERFAREVLPGRPEPSPIVAVVTGSEASAVAASAALLTRGLYVPAVRPPTVAPGSSRLRVSLSAAHAEAEVTSLVAALDDLGLCPVW